MFQPQYLINAKINENISEVQLEDLNENQSEDCPSITYSSQSITEVDEIPNDVSNDLCKISEFGKFGNMLNLKDFSNSIAKNKTNKLHGDTTLTEFVQISVDENSMMVVKKSSLCWLFDNKNKKISNDRLCRFINHKNHKNLAKNKRGNQVTGQILVPKKQKIVHQQNNSFEDSDDDLDLCDNKNIQNVWK